jgi:hypothetical protein
VLAVALVAAGWLVTLDRRESTARKDGARALPADSPALPGNATEMKDDRLRPTGRKDFQRPATGELAERHEIKPDDKEWENLLRLLRAKLPEPPTEEDREIVEAVMARFTAHAGARQVDDLAAIYRNASSAEAGQRALEVLGTLQSEEFQERAREIISDSTLPADDQVVTALARSLVGSGTPEDVVMVLDRIDTGKARDHTEYNGMDGLMAAVGLAMDPEMEDVLCEALSNKTGTRTWTARLAAAAALQHHATSGATRALTEARNDGDARVAAEARDSLEVLRNVEE